MTSKSPRIYTYKITFEEVPYYYYGSKKEKYYNQEYWGSPKTHKWCWEFYTPKKQILEFFDYTDDGYEECKKIENRLIKSVLNDPWSLNESCGGIYSLGINRKTGKKTQELGIGIFSQTKKQLSDNGKKGTRIQKESKVGLFSLTETQRSENGKKYGGIGGKKSGNMSKELNTGICGLSIEQRVENGKKYGSIGGNISKELGLGICGLTTEERREIARKTNSQKWQCLETGYISTPSGLTRYQRNRGIDTSKRIRLE